MRATRPVVKKRSGERRYGRGFSQTELQRAGLSKRDALKLKIPVDPRRRTLHDDNVQIISEILKRRTKVQRETEQTSKT